MPSKTRQTRNTASFQILEEQFAANQAARDIKHLHEVIAASQEGTPETRGLLAGLNVASALVGGFSSLMGGLGAMGSGSSVETLEVELVNQSSFSVVPMNYSASGSTRMVGKAHPLMYNEESSFMATDAEFGKNQPSTIDIALIIGNENTVKLEVQWAFMNPREPNNLIGNRDEFGWWPKWVKVDDGAALQFSSNADEYANPAEPSLRGGKLMSPEDGYPDVSLYMQATSHHTVKTSMIFYNTAPT